MRQRDDIFISTSDAAKITGMSDAWFEKQRSLGIGPPVYKIGGKSVRYKIIELLDWFESCKKGGVS